MKTPFKINQKIHVAGASLPVYTAALHDNRNVN